MELAKSREQLKLSVDPVYDELEHNTLKQHEQMCQCTRVDKVMTAVLIIVAAILVVVIVTVTVSFKPSPSKVNTLSDTECDDVAIIGAGIGGAYAAWRLREDGLSVTVYEYSDRIGGRMLTRHFPNMREINVELGAMRFLPQVHTKLNEVANKLNLTLVDFTNGLGLSQSTMMYLRGRHVKKSDLKGKNNPYNLQDGERGLTPEELRWKLFSNHTSYDGETISDLMESLWNVTTYDRFHQKLFYQSDEVAKSNMCSNEAYNYLRDTFGFHSHNGGLSSLLSIPTREPAKVVGPRLVKTVEDGMQYIPQTLMKHFLSAKSKPGCRHAIQYNRQLTHIARRDRHTFDLKFTETETKDGYTSQKNAKRWDEGDHCVKSVILAVPRLALEYIEWRGLKQTNILDYLKNAVIDAPAAKVFLSYQTAWWRSTKLNFTHSVSDLPNRQTYDFGTTSTGEAVLVAVYTDMDGVRYWRTLKQRGTKFNGSDDLSNSATTELVEHAHKHLAELYNISVNAIPEPLGAMVSFWDEYPYGAAWTVWKPGYNWTEVRDRMLRPDYTENVYAVCSAFMPGEGPSWSESSLEYVDLLFDKYGSNFRNQPS